MTNGNSLELVCVKNKDEIIKVAELADSIWHEHYRGILKKEQIDYMIGKFQSQGAVINQMKRQGYEYYLIKWRGEFAGYVGIVENKADLFLSKLYILKEFRGKGLFSYVLECLIKRCKEKNLYRIWLTVNKQNSSIAVYIKKGFKTFNTQVTDIGGGYIMDDYLMELKV